MEAAEGPLNQAPAPSMRPAVTPSVTPAPLPGPMSAPALAPLPAPMPTPAPLPTPMPTSALLPTPMPAPAPLRAHMMKPAPAPASLNSIQGTSNGTQQLAPASFLQPSGGLLNGSWNTASAEATSRFADSPGKSALSPAPGVGGNASSKAAPRGNISSQLTDSGGSPVGLAGAVEAASIP